MTDASSLTVSITPTAAFPFRSAATIRRPITSTITRPITSSGSSQSASWHDCQACEGGEDRTASNHTVHI
jgi:hypothetical protein